MKIIDKIATVILIVLSLMLISLVGSAIVFFCIPELEELMFMFMIGSAFITIIMGVLTLLLMSIQSKIKQKG